MLGSEVASGFHFARSQYHLGHTPSPAELLGAREGKCYQYGVSRVVPFVMMVELRMDGLMGLIKFGETLAQQGAPEVLNTEGLKPLQSYRLTQKVSDANEAYYVVQSKQGILSLKASPTQYCVSFPFK